MIKRFYLLTIQSVLLLFLFPVISCKKDKETVNPGIRYGITGVEPAMAGAGDTISIYGAGFQNNVTGNTVKINGAEAKVITASANTLRVIVPGAPRNGNITVQTGSNTNTYDKVFAVITVVKDNISTDTKWTADQIYLLKGNVHMLTGSKLTIEAGTTILGDKTSRAALIIDQGATVAMNGTAASPVVFSSNQAITFRQPGDWKGIELSGDGGASPGDVIKYVRIEYAGYHQPEAPGAALRVSRATTAGNINNIQASYSAGDGYLFDSARGSSQYIDHLIAYGCAGNDFTYTNGVEGYGQFLLGIKDPVYADQLRADGLLVQSSRPVTISNLTLIGYNGLARQIVPNTTYLYGLVDDEVLNANAGRGVRIGGMANVNGVLTPASGTLRLFNSVIAAPWLAGISVDGAASWAGYENGSTGSVIRNTSVTYTLADGTNAIRTLPGSPPFRGYSFSAENITGSRKGFERIDGTTQAGAFMLHNDTARLMLLPYPTYDAPYDDYGLTNSVQYNKLTSPVFSPVSGSLLLSGADFSSAMLANTFFARNTAFRGAFGGTDWAASWSNYQPQQVSYQ
ncbi:hypothetical protein GCM10023149_08540 [Mucilaginibacter gynuensis]|uniref:IPT/TIG domain-containing protein n=1 Tax=Mucilaginibacter gynuensis TaxID=1302236 RepID=A0ABP8FXG3_9SPHI